MLRRVLAALSDFVYPPQCLGENCSRVGSWMCEPCLAAVCPVPPPVCEACGAPIRAGRLCRRCRTKLPSYRRAVAAGLYGGVIRAAVHALKFRGITDLVEPLADLAYAAAGTLPQDALVVSVPASPTRLAERGIDHAGLLASAIAGKSGLDHANGILVRTTDVRPQVGLAIEERWANVARAFRAPHRLGPRPIVLVDDVLTTGATAEACTRELLAAGAVTVDVCCVARSAYRFFGSDSSARL